MCCRRRRTSFRLRPHVSGRRIHRKYAANTGLIAAFPLQPQIHPAGPEVACPAVRSPAELARMGPTSELGIQFIERPHRAGVGDVAPRPHDVRMTTAVYNRVYDEGLTAAASAMFGTERRSETVRAG